HGTRPPLAWRWRRARLPPASRLDSLRRPDRLASHHGPRLAACRVVDCRNQGIDPISTAPWARGKIRARQWPRPVLKTQNQDRPAAASRQQRLGALDFQVVSDSLMKSVGVLPSRRLNMVENALGLS